MAIGNKKQLLRNGRSRKLLLVLASTLIFCSKCRETQDYILLLRNAYIYLFHNQRLTKVYRITNCPFVSWSSQSRTHRRKVRAQSGQ
jgi:hypothetical protein